MKFSIRQFLVFIVVIGLIFGFVASQLKLRRADAEIAKLRELAGFTNASGDGYFLYVCGGQDILDRFEAFNGCLLLRVFEYQKYKLRLTHYDSQTKAKKTHDVDINEPLISLTCIPWSKGQTFSITPTVPVNPKTKYFNYRTTMKDHRCFLLSDGALLGVHKHPIGGFGFLPDSQTESPKLSELAPGNEENLCQVCDKYQMQAVYFTIMPRD
jgi:hypothetical protein